MSVCNSSAAFFMFCLLGAAPVALADPPQELPGAQDPVVVSRYKGSVLHNASHERYAALRIPLGPGKYTDSGGFAFEKSVTVEGSIDAYYYVQAPDVQPLEVIRNYEKALVNAGFAPLYGCEPSACAKANLPEGYRREFLAKRPWADLRINPGGGSSPRELHHWSGKATRNGAEVYVIVWVTEPTSVWNACTATVVVVEPHPMLQDQVTATLDQLERGLNTEGKIAVPGVYFDTGKTELKATSKPQLDEMAKLMKAKPGLKVFIVGHTDNVGSVDANVKLSQGRAEAVVAALVTQYGVDPKRLSARGVANFSPVASNADAAGQARNRRVEIVAQ